MEAHLTYRKNVWLLTSIATQADADRNIPELLKCRDLAPVLGVSAEPLLEGIDLSRWMWPVCWHWKSGTKDPRTMDEQELRDAAARGDCWQKKQGLVLAGTPHLDLVITGGESGPHARPCNVDWIRSIRDQCKSAGVACFVKQLGAKPYRCDGYHDASAATYGAKVSCMGDACSGQPQCTDSKGGDWDEWPEDLRVREMPKC